MKKLFGQPQIHVSSIKPILYQNKAYTKNTPPHAPNISSSKVSGNSVVLSWHHATDDHASSEGLSYNIRVGPNQGGNDVVSSNAADDGYFRLAQIGNAQLDTFFILKKPAYRHLLLERAGHRQLL